MRQMTTAAAAALTLALAACSGEGGGPGPTEGSGSASPGSPPQSTSPSSPDTSATSADSSSSTDTGAPFDRKKFTNRLEEAIEADPTVRLSVDVTIGEKSTLTAAGVQDFEEEALDMEVDTNGQSARYLLVNGNHYLAQPPKWLTVDEDSDNPVFEQIRNLSMRRQLDAFLTGVTSVGDKGSQKINGVDTRHYTATVDTEKSFAELDLDVGEGTPQTQIYDVWLDQDNLIHKMKLVQEGSVITITAKDWGEPVTIKEPNPSEIAGEG